MVLQEEAQMLAEGVKLPAATSGQHIRRRGDDIRPGDRLVAAGQRMAPQDIGLLASVGIDALKVFRPLTLRTVIIK